MPAQKPRHIELAFRTWAPGVGLSLDDAIEPMDLIDRMIAFYTAVPFARRRQGTDADMLLFQTGDPPDDSWQVDVTRQLYSRGRGHQLSFSLSVPRSVRPFPGYVTLWSRDSADIDDWSAQAHAALAAFGPLPAGTPALMRAEF